MEDDFTRKQDTLAKEPFNLTEWLTHEVKLPQYTDVFLKQGFQLPLECCGIDEAALNVLGIVKIGHRKRILVSCHKLAERYGLAGAMLNSGGKMREKQKASDSMEVADVDDTPPVLPPKKGKKSKPTPPPRRASANDALDIQQEVNTSSTREESSNAVSGIPEHSCSDPLNKLSVTKSLTLESDEKQGIDRMTTEEILDSAGLPSGNLVTGYEPIWEASEGDPLPASPLGTATEASTSDSFLAEHNCVNIGTLSGDHVQVSANTSSGDQVQVSTNTSTVHSDDDNSKSPSILHVGAPPIPPRADLEDMTSDMPNASIPATEEHFENEAVIEQVRNSTLESAPNLLPQPVEVREEEKQVSWPRKSPPRKPPRRNKPSMPAETGHAEGSNESSLHFGHLEGGRSVEVIYDNEVFAARTQVSEKHQDSILEEKTAVSNTPVEPEQEKGINASDSDNIYGNAEEIRKLPVQKMPSMPVLDSNGLPVMKKPVPVPRTKSLSEKPNSEPETSSKFIPELPKKSTVGQTKSLENLMTTAAAMPKRSVKHSSSAGNLLASHAETASGSCTEDDLSGSDEEEMPEAGSPIPSAYETVDIPRPTSVALPRHSSKEGYLFKQGGQQNNKGWKKRWVVFDGAELCYYKDKEHTDESLQIVPVAIMKEVRIVTEDTKRARFNLICAGRTYMFALGSEDMGIIQVWAQILMGAIIRVRKENQNDINSVPGGDMFDPDKKGFLKKQGNNVVADWKKRYVAIKDGKMAYYHNYEDFIFATPINTLQMNLASVKQDPRSQSRFQLVTPHRTYLFQCEDERELRSWVAALETAIQLALSDRTVIDKVWRNPSNRYCADCGKKDPLWASVNLVVCVCAHCIGVHRRLGVHTSKPRSLLMDEKIWSPSLIKLMVEVGNDAANEFWKFTFPEDDQIDPDCASEAREEFIRDKYEEKKYRHVSPLYGDRVALGEALRKAVVTSDVKQTIQLVFCGAEVKYVSENGSDTRTPYELARDANQALQMEFLLQNGGANAEPEYECLSTSVGIYEEIGSDSPVFNLSSSTITYEKEGFLHKKAPSAAVWRKRYFALKGRELWYDKGDKEERAVIRLKDVDEYIYNDSVTLDIVTPERTYNLRADTKEEALSWYTVLRNKQVFQIPLKFQELGSDGIPHLVAKCLQFVETHGLDSEGIYRKNGNKAKIKRLRKLFDQDAESVVISREEYEAHDVAGLIKEYFRELPDPLMTEDAYAHFITASLSPDHNSKLHMYKDSLNRLPDVNRNTLKTVISHLARITAHSSQNLMKFENISLIFGPTLMSNKQMGAMDTNTINQEFTVIGDFITYYKWLFDVGDDEVLKDQRIEEAMKKIEQASRNSQLEFNELTLDVYVLSKKQESSRITVYSNSKASQICQEIVSKRAMAPDGNWALFQVVSGQLERPFQATERVLATVLETGKYSQLSKGSCLIVQDNYVAQKMMAYGFQDDTSLVAAATLQTMKETRKKDSWKKLFVKLEKGVLAVYKNAKSRDGIDSWPVSDTTLYLGVDRDKKPTSRYGFTIVRNSKDSQCIYRYICVDDEREQYRWISLFLKLKYPGKDLWVDPDLEPIGYYAEAGDFSQTNPVSRTKSTSKLNAGVSSSILNELRLKQKSIGK